MNKALNLGDTLPEISLKIAGGDDISVPSGIETPFLILLFYRGHW